MPSHDLISKIPKGSLFRNPPSRNIVIVPGGFQLRYLEQLHWPGVETEPIWKMNGVRSKARYFIAHPAISIGLARRKVITTCKHA